MRPGKEIDLLLAIRAKARSAVLASYPTDTASGPLASFPDGADDVPVVDLKVSILPAQEGSGDPSPENIRPISGWTGVKLTRSGKNLVFAPTNIDDTVRGVTFSHTEDDKLKISGTATGGAASINTGTRWDNALYGPYPAGTYTVTALGLIGKTTVDRVAVGGKYEDGTDVHGLSGGVRISGPLGQIADGSGNPKTFTAQRPFKLLFSFSFEEGNTIDSTISFLMQKGDSVTTWEPYAGTAYTIGFPAEAGTVYGGTLDVTTGLLTVTHGQIASYAGETLPGTWISDRDVYAEGTSPSTGAQVVYELAEPITYQLTPTQVRTLYGENNLWADTGDVTAEYRADLEKYIEKKIGEGETQWGTDLRC